MRRVFGRGVDLSLHARPGGRAEFVGHQRRREPADERLEVRNGSDRQAAEEQAAADRQKCLRIVARGGEVAVQCSLLHRCHHQGKTAVG